MPGVNGQRDPERLWGASLEFGAESHSFGDCLGPQVTVRVGQPGAGCPQSTGLRGPGQARSGCRLGGRSRAGCRAGDSHPWNREGAEGWGKSPKGFPSAHALCKALHVLLPCLPCPKEAPVWGCPPAPGPTLAHIPLPGGRAGGTAGSLAPCPPSPCLPPAHARPHVQGEAARSSPSLGLVSRQQPGSSSPGSLSPARPPAVPAICRRWQPAAPGFLPAPGPRCSGLPLSQTIPGNLQQAQPQGAHSFAQRGGEILSQDVPPGKGRLLAGCCRAANGGERALRTWRCLQHAGLPSTPSRRLPPAPRRHGGQAARTYARASPVLLKGFCFFLSGLDALQEQLGDLNPAAAEAPGLQVKTS